MRFRLRTLLIVLLIFQVLIGCGLIVWKIGDEVVRHSTYGTEYRRQKASPDEN